MKKLLVIFAVAFAAMSSQAAYLYWQVMQNDNISAVETVMGSTWSTAKLIAYDSSAKTSTSLSSATRRTTGTIEKYYYNIADFSDSKYSFYIELVNSTGTAIARSNASSWQSYTQLESEKMIVTDELEVTHATWNGGTYTATPEPTSALLMMLGFAGLALRRKQRSQA